MRHQKQSLIDTILANIDHGVMVCNSEDLIQKVNPAFEEMSGYTTTEALGKNLNILFPEGHDVSIFSNLKESLDKDNFYQEDVTIRCRNGNLCQLQLSFHVFSGLTEEVCGNYVVIFRVPSNSVTLGNVVGPNFQIDGLTDLPDQILFRDRSEQSIIAAKRVQKSVAILIIGLDRFTIINDGLGHSFGDSLLKSVALRLQSCIRDSDTLARIEGDRFGMVLQVAATDDSVIVAEKVLKEMKQPFIIEGQEVSATASIGISMYPDDGGDYNDLAKNAESAMRHAKRKGGSQYLCFDNNMNMRARKRIEMENDLRRALQNDEFILYYQPKVNAETQEIIGMEALIRWQDPEKGLIPPGAFIPVAEETGLIGPIGSWVIKKACVQNKQWQGKGLQPVRVSVNVSGHQFRESGFVDKVRIVLEDSGLSPQYLELEITESLLMGDTEEIIRKMRQIRDLGCYLSIDDFGTGYSSLGYLTRFPITALKIDKSFVQGIEDSQSAVEVARAIIGLSKGLKLEVVAEGAENIKHVDFLRQHGCETVQGFYFSRPVPPEEFEKLLEVGFIKRG